MVGGKGRICLTDELMEHEQSKWRGFQIPQKWGSPFWGSPYQRFCFCFGYLLGSPYLGKLSNIHGVVNHPLPKGPNQRNKMKFRFTLRSFQPSLVVWVASSKGEDSLSLQTSHHFEWRVLFCRSLKLRSSIVLQVPQRTRQMIFQPTVTPW